MNPIGQNKTLQFLSTAMSVAQKRHNVIASNIANIDTPGYRAKDFSFESVMKDAQRALGSAEQEAVSTVKSGILESGIFVRETNDVVWQKMDGNNVNLEKEMAKLSAVAGKYKVAARLFMMKYTLIRDQLKG